MSIQSFVAAVGLVYIAYKLASFIRLLASIFFLPGEPVSIFLYFFLLVEFFFIIFLKVRVISIKGLYMRFMRVIYMSNLYNYFHTCKVSHLARLIDALFPSS